MNPFDQPLETYGWQTDFEYVTTAVYTGLEDWSKPALIAFQKLWNRAAVGAGVGSVANMLNEEGTYDFKTDYALWSAPCGGFPNIGLPVDNPPSNGPFW